MELGYKTTQEYKKASGLDSWISARNAAKRSASMKKKLKENPELKESRAKKLRASISEKKDVWSEAARKRWAGRTEEEKQEILQKGFRSPEARERAHQAIKENWDNLTEEERARRCQAISDMLSLFSSFGSRDVSEGFSFFMPGEDKALFALCSIREIKESCCHVAIGDSPCASIFNAS